MDRFEESKGKKRGRLEQAGRRPLCPANTLFQGSHCPAPQRLCHPLICPEIASAVLVNQSTGSSKPKAV